MWDKLGSLPGPDGADPVKKINHEPDLQQEKLAPPIKTFPGFAGDGSAMAERNPTMLAGTILKSDLNAGGGVSANGVPAPVACLVYRLLGMPSAISSSHSSQ